MNHMFIVVTAFCAAIVSPAFATIQLGGSVSDDRPSLVYDPESGDLSAEGGGRLFTTLQIDTGPGIMKNCTDVGFLDTCPDRLFRLIPQGVDALTFDRAFYPGLPPESVMEQVTATGSLLPSGGFHSDLARLGPNISQIDLVYVPEPSGRTCTLVLVAGFALMAVRRRRAGH